jgi:hypothetical protein
MRFALAVVAALVLASSASAAAPSVEKLILKPGQVGNGYVMLARRDGAGVKGTVTMNLCGIDYASELRRATRLQVDYLKNGSPIGLSNEVVTYRRGGAAQAISEALSHAITCPSTPMPSGVPGVPPLRYQIRRLTVPGLLEGYVAVRVHTIGTVNGKKVDQISYAIYQRLGNVLSGVYSFGPDTKAQRDFAYAAARQSAKNLRRAGSGSETPAA